MNCISLLKAMELEDLNTELEMEEIENGEMEQDTLGLPEEWMHCCMDQTSGEIGLNCLIHKEDQPDTEKSQTTVVVPQEEKTQNDIEENEALQEDQVQKRQAKSKKKKVWGPIQPERRSKRQPQDGVPVLERAGFEDEKQSGSA
jgi:hypothetical protein